MRILIKNGTIVDGTGKNAFKAQLLIENDVIKDISENIEGEFDIQLDASRMHVCPGFIDTHSHSDLHILEDGFIRPKIFQGITTEILGQDGISLAPLPEEYIDDWKKNLSGLAGYNDEISWDFKTAKIYFDRLKKARKGFNVAYLAPHGNIRMEAMGLGNKIADDNDLAKMKDILKRELEAGCVGLSTGLIYIPCAYADTKELIELNKVVAKYDKVFVVHQRSEADFLVSSIEEVLEIARKSGVRVHFSHFKICGMNNWGKMGKVMEMLDKAHNEGIRISFDQYPYLAGSTMLSAVIPPWVHEGGTGKLVERLKDDEIRKKIIRDINTGISGWDNFLRFCGFDGIFITDVKTKANKSFVGKNIAQISLEHKKNPFHVIFDLLVEEENSVGMVDFYGTQSNIEDFMRSKYQNVCTDGLLGGTPHPRVYGAFPKFLGDFVRDKGILSIEEGIRKMTKKGADVFGIKDRGVLKVGNKADIVVFDYDTICANSTYTNPCELPWGIEYVLVNGKIVLEEGKLRRKAAGKVVKL